MAISSGTVFVESPSIYIFPLARAPRPPPPPPSAAYDPIASMRTTRFSMMLGMMPQGFDGARACCLQRPSAMRDRACIDDRAIARHFRPRGYFTILDAKMMQAARRWLMTIAAYRRHDFGHNLLFSLPLKDGDTR